MTEKKTRFIDPTNDFGFKILYGFPECADELKELLEHIIPEKKIVIAIRLSSSWTRARTTARPTSYMSSLS